MKRGQTRVIGSSSPAGLEWDEILRTLKEKKRVPILVMLLSDAEHHLMEKTASLHARLQNFACPPGTVPVVVSGNTIEEALDSVKASEQTVSLIALSPHVPDYKGVAARLKARWGCAPDAAPRGMQVFDVRPTPPQ